jgi:hypothetical protein
VVSELTLASMLAGTCCCMAVPKKVLNSDDPAPHAKAAAATHGAAACSAIGMSGSA